MIIRATTANRPIDHNIDELNSIQPMFFEKIGAQNWNKLKIPVSNLKHKQLLLI